jgi:predicted transcriptional regulator
MSSKAILLSIKPQYVSKIASGEKTYELRRQKPKIEPSSLAMVYASSPSKCLVGAFIVGKVLHGKPDYLWRKVGKFSGVTRDEFFRYYDGCKKGCAIGIERFWELDNQVELAQMRERANIEPPQSYRYLCSDQMIRLVS